MNNLSNIHPGEVLLKEFLNPYRVSQNKCARDIDVSSRRINEICLQKRAVTVDTAIRLGRYFGTTAQFWLAFQIDYDLEIAYKLKSEQYDAIGPFMQG